MVGGTLVTNTSTGATTYTAGALEIYTDGNITISGQGTAINSVTTQSYTPASTGVQGSRLTNQRGVEPIHCGGVFVVFAS